jgi:hypothetical protein
MKMNDVIRRRVKVQEAILDGEMIVLGICLYLPIKMSNALFLNFLIEIIFR